MSDEQRLVTEFHRAFDIVIGSSPSIPDAATCALRVNLMQEEFDELRAALAQRDVEAVAKELADLLYVVYGTAVSCGLDMAPVFREVHRSNMSKVGGHKRADGKWLKPPGYAPAHLQPILAAQGMLEYQHRGGQAHPPASEDSQHVRPTPMDGTRTGENVALHCPQCGTHFVRRSHRQGVKERFLSLASVYPFRCQVCGHRFKALQSRVRSAPHLLDRRQYERLSTHVPTTYTASVKSGGARVGEGMVSDVSLGGCYLHTAVPASEGTLLSLQLQTGEHTPAIPVETAIVRTARPTGVGLEFLHLDEAAQERLSRLVRQLLTERHADEHEAEST